MLGVEKSRKLLFFSKKVPKKFKNHDITRYIGSNHQEAWPNACKKHS